MFIIDKSLLTKDIHFPVTKACYTKAPKRNIFQRVFHFMTYKRKFEVMQEYILWIPYLDSWCFVPSTFIFDGASVPKILNSIFNPTGMLLLGALPHDFGYRYKGLMLVNCDTRELNFAPFSKRQLDEIFHNLNSWESGLPAASKVATGVLKLFGFVGWRQNRKRAAVLKKDFPGLFITDEMIESGVDFLMDTSFGGE